ncbi:hypothetical protein ASD00_32065 [Ensifer sp. Root31]|uniref:TetR/AcrR family transcriptional regulator n=1 Tax=Ensifer sp. Root31 TaxID=1736512 RepID=UPI00070A4E2A|nr:TetR/AcrR family transcriptional regulator [Ensifer sp. Root31]KQU85629.1 hypothetical protein ASD00_32065 [Ensifer sp. Root31]
MARPRQFEHERVIDAAMNVFWRKGFEATSAQDLVDATGLGRGSLYNAFSSKEGLYLEALRRYKEQALHDVGRLEEGGNAKGAVRNLLFYVFESDLSGTPRRGCLATNAAIERASHDEDVATLVRENLEIVRTGLERVLRLGQEAGEVAAGRDPEVLAAYFLNAIQGLRVLNKVNLPTSREQLTEMIELILNVL